MWSAKTLSKSMRLQQPWDRPTSSWPGTPKLPMAIPQNSKRSNSTKLSWLSMPQTSPPTHDSIAIWNESVLSITTPTVMKK